jgi:hypothetical protein
VIFFSRWEQGMYGRQGRASCGSCLKKKNFNGSLHDALHHPEKMKMLFSEQGIEER